MFEMDGKWNWISMIDKLSGEDFTKHEQIYERNWIECLNFLSYLHERDKYLAQFNKLK